VGPEGPAEDKDSEEMSSMIENDINDSIKPRAGMLQHNSNAL
jgi:hypothetical protein